MIRFALALSLFLSGSALATEEIEGWRFPGESDYKWDWAEYRDNLPTPFFVEADFDGDGMKDEAWILISTDEKEWALFVLMHHENGEREVIELDRTSMVDQWPQSMGISLTPPGSYKTACGKEYWECESDETEFLVLELAGLSYFQYESASSEFFWNSKHNGFKRIWTSD